VVPERQIKNKVNKAMDKPKHRAQGRKYSFKLMFEEKQHHSLARVLVED